MANVCETPTKSRQNAFLERYMNHLSPEQPKLMEVSPSRINSSNNIFSQLKGSSVKKASSNKAILKPISTKNGNPFNSISENKENLQESKFDTSKLTREETAYYEFLCRVGEIKRWIEEVIEESLPSELDLCIGDSMRNGVYLAQVTQRINRDLAPTIFPASDKLQFKHTQNINAFFSLVDHVGLPNSFRFELQDLYNKKSLPQVFETIYILITLINKKWPKKTPDLKSLSGELSFTKDELRKCQKVWPRIRDFKSLSISPVASPNNKKNKSLVNSSLINDFGTYDKCEDDTHEQLKTPTKISDTLMPVVLAPPDTPSRTATPQSERTPLKTTHTESNFLDTEQTELQLNTNALKYRPLKNTSLSYYSPTISKYLTYDTDFYMSRSRARERDLDYFSKFNYGPVEYSPKRRQKMTETEFLESVVRIQSSCRAVNLRFSLHIRRNLLNLFGKEVTLLQAAVRSTLIRRRSDISKFLQLIPLESTSLASVQAIFKAFLFRNNLDQLRIRYLRQEDKVSHFQRISRGYVIRKNTRQQICDIQESEFPLRNFQAVLSGTLYRSRHFGRCLCLSNDTKPIHHLQGICRGAIIRNAFKGLTDNVLSSSVTIFASLQSIARGVLIRSALERMKDNLEEHNNVLKQLSANMKALRVRNSIPIAICVEEMYFEPVNSLQASIRGILVRFALDLVDDFVEYNGLIGVQARLRGHLIRYRLNKRNTLFTKNLRSIVLIQSKIRMFLHRSSYFEIMQSPNPSLSSVRIFAHLLNDIGTIEEVQDKLEQFQAQLDSENQKKEKLEKDIRQQMDLSEVLQKFDLISDTPTLINKLDIPKGKFPVFERLFYLLQVDPSYWKILYSRYPDFVRENAYSCFTTMNQRMGEREKTYFIRLVNEIMQCEMVEADTVHHFLNNENQLWRSLFKEFLRREYPELFGLFVPLLQFISDPKVDFESDPHLIYRKIHNREPASRSVAIEDQQTKMKFIENLRCIWHSVEIIAEIFTRSVNKFPLEARYLSTKLFSYAADKNAAEDEALKAISTVFLQGIVFEFVENRSHYGYDDGNSSALVKKIEISINALWTVFSLEKFHGYYDPLNQYAFEMNSQIKVLLLNILLDPEYEQNGDRLVYHDMLSKTPRLEVFTERLLKITSKLQECEPYFPDDDVLHDLFKDKVDTSSLPKSGRIVLDLIPTSHRFLVSDDRMRKVYDQVKRAFIYMMQVEEVNTDLYDLALSCVIPNDEPVFTSLIESYKKIKTDPIIRALDSPPYFNLKNITLRKIHELENMDVLNPSNNRLQNFLNDIANTIKNPRYAIDYVSKELEVTHKTLCGISKINHDLISALTDLRRSNNRAIKTIQNSNKYLPVHKGPLGNLKGAYKRAQSKNSLGMDGLKFKWTTRQLYEKGVLKSITGEKLAEQRVKVFGSSGPRFPEIIFKLSTSDGSTFGIQLQDKRKGPDKRQSDSVDTFDFNDLLNTQIGSKKDTWHLLNGKVAFKTSELLNLIVMTFLKNEVHEK